MASGTIAEIDDSGAFGLIEGDGGDLLIFNARAVSDVAGERLAVGARVEFAIEQVNAHAPRATQLRIL
jgi:cold shock CspA family protein